MVKKRIFQLDFLRFIAITPVFFLHFFTSLRRNNFEFGLGWTYEHVIRYGGWGVELFFVLSGFLMTSKILLNVEKEFSFKILKQYLKSRFYRIYPLFFITTLLIFFAGLIFKIFDISENSHEFLKTIFLIQQFFSSDFNIINPVTWSLEIEVQFYIFIGILMFLFNFFQVDKRKFILIGCFVVSVIITLISRENFIIRHLFFYIDFFFLGVLLKLFYDENKAFFEKSSFFYDILFLSVFPLIYLVKFYSQYSHILILIIYFILFISVFKLKYFSFIIKNYFFQLLGKISFSFYLLHYVIIEFYFIFLSKHFTFPIIINCILLFIIINLISYVFYKYIEINNLFKP